MGQPPATPTSRAMSLPELAPEDLLDLQSLQLDLRTPLWFYVLREAAVMASAERLGPVGGGIVAEVMVGLLEADSQSYLS